MCITSNLGDTLRSFPTWESQKEAMSQKEVVYNFFYISAPFIYIVGVVLAVPYWHSYPLHRAQETHVLFYKIEGVAVLALWLSLLLQ